MKKLTPRIMQEMLCREKELLTQWEEAYPYFIRYKKEIDKLSLQFKNKKIAFVHLLDSTYRENDHDEIDKIALGNVIKNLIFDLTCDDEDIDKAILDSLKNLHDKYSEIKFDIRRSKYDAKQLKLLKIATKLSTYDLKLRREMKLNCRFKGWRFFYMFMNYDDNCTRTSESYITIDENEMKKLYRELSSKYHPDKFTQKSAEIWENANKIMSLINLSNQEKNYYALLHISKVGDEILSGKSFTKDNTTNNNHIEDLKNSVNSIEIMRCLKKEIESVNDKLEDVLNECYPYVTEYLDYDSSKLWIIAMEEHIKDTKNAIKRLNVITKNIRSSKELQKGLHNWRLPILKKPRTLNGYENFNHIENIGISNTS